MSSNQEQVAADIELQKMFERRNAAQRQFVREAGPKTPEEHNAFKQGFREAWMQQQETINILRDCIAETARFMHQNASQFSNASIALQGVADCE